MQKHSQGHEFALSDAPTVEKAHIFTIAVQVDLRGEEDGRLN
jgi:hypothetical protein